MPDRRTYRRGTGITAQNVANLGQIQQFLFDNF
jgi:hypothetical protein